MYLSWFDFNVHDFKVSDIILKILFTGCVVFT